MTERWFFYQDIAGLWKWARLDVMGTVLGHSGCSFETRDGCIEHARSNGYEEGGPEVGLSAPQGAASRSTLLQRDPR
jgi:hypothetical protein